MLTHPTLEQMRALKLDGMAQAFIELESQDRAKDLGHAEWLALLLDREIASRATRRFETRMRKAHLRHSQASIEDVDYRTPRRLDKALFQQLAAWGTRDVAADAVKARALYEKAFGLGVARAQNRLDALN